MDEKLLEEIGLTKSEVKVYLSLLELGSSATGKVVDKSGVSSSKIYEILERLMQKGLVSYIVKSGIKFFEAAPPERIMDYMKEKEQYLDKQKDALKKILPELELKRMLSKYTTEATIYKGLKGGETAFQQLLSSMTKKDEWIGFVISFTNQPYFHRLTKLHDQRAKMGFKARLIFDEMMREEGKEREHLPHTQIKYVPNSLRTPAIVNVAGNMTLINIMAEDVTVFQIINKDVADSFRQQFERLWDQRVFVDEGQQAVNYVYNSLIESSTPRDEVIVFAAMPATKEGADFNLRWTEAIRQKVKRHRLLYYGDTQEQRQRAEEFVKRNCEVKILPSEQTNPISTVVMGDYIVNAVWGKEPTVFKIQDKVVADSLRANFELQWNQEAKILKGLDAVQEIFEDMLRAGHVDFLGARGYFIDKRPEYMKDWERRAKASGFTMRNIVDSGVKGHLVTTYSFAETKYIIPKEFVTLSVYWIYGNKVAITNWVDEEPLVLVIENKKYFDLYKKQFETIWNGKVTFSEF